MNSLSGGRSRAFGGGLASRGAARVVTAGPAISLENVSCTFQAKNGGQQLALEDISLTIDQGELICFLGPSGSGKSTLLNVVAGLVKPSSGRVRSGAEDVKGPGPDRAVVFQDAALFPWLTLEQNIAFPLELAKASHAAKKERVESLLRLVHLWHFRDRYPHELSGGMRQRGGIARALANDPAVLLLDEPFGALDAQTRELLHAEIERIHDATKKTMLFVTHSVVEAVRLADRIVLMGTRPGRIMDVLTVDLPRPRHSADEKVAELVMHAGAAIAREVDKVAREEEGRA
ncbi:MAG: ABC transporter ATP-binding protein [Polyangiaceae bacterium]